MSFRPTLATGARRHGRWDADAVFCAHAASVAKERSELVEAPVTRWHARHLLPDCNHPAAVADDEMPILPVGRRRLWTGDKRLGQRWGTRCVRDIETVGNAFLKTG